MEIIFTLCFVIYSTELANESYLAFYYITKLSLYGCLNILFKNNNNNKKPTDTALFTVRKKN